MGDGFAAVFGEALGRTVLPLNKGKTVEGSAFGFIFAFSGALLFVNPTKALISSAVGILVELLPLPVNDNLTTPLITGLALILIP